jgi:hypothetical protein
MTAQTPVRMVNKMHGAWMDSVQTRPTAAGLRRLVKDGAMTPQAALDYLARARRAGNFVKPEIEEWLRRKLS